MTGTTGKAGRPRSEHSRAAILHAVDDLVAEIGYNAVTFKGIAERAGVSRQTIYRWWSTKAEVLLEASALDARGELSITPTGDPAVDLTAYLDALTVFLTDSDAGFAYRALLGEAQHDKAVAALLHGRDIIGDSAASAIARVMAPGDLAVTVAEAAADLVGATFFWILSGRDPALLDNHTAATRFLAAHATDEDGRAS